ncbi:hypothetical protein Ami103574_06950 [Aminipila butyrica]|uniref:Uncharacterized protein n=1 Tax=Aminipila butyrica TaxID=433296 RepID=A0A858BT28_9FIRM|nr:hypothetical protein [Aminipila butyrica]QIB69073.1 hypothetical protein Ami103574_06950 [Aminipila butyrica]
MKLRYLGKIYQAYYTVPAALQIVNCSASGSISGDQVRWVQPMQKQPYPWNMWMIPFSHRR